MASHIKDYDLNETRNNHIRMGNIVNSLSNNPREKTDEFPQNIVKGLDSQANDLIIDGFVPIGDMKITYSPTYVFPGSATTMGGEPSYYQQFIKYEP